MRTWFITQKRRAKEGLMQAVGVHQGTEDTEFDVRTRSFSDHVNQLQRVKEAMELWLDSFDSFCAAGVILGDAFRNLAYCPNGPIDQQVNSFENYTIVYQQMNLDMFNSIRPSMRDLFVNRCLKPVSTILSLVPPIFEDLQSRKNILLDFDAYRVKIHKEIATGKDFNHPNIIKINTKLDDTSKALALVQARISHAFDEFESAKPTMLSQEFAALISCQYHYSSFSLSMMGSLLPFFPQSSSSLSLLTLSHPPLRSLESMQSISSLQSSLNQSLPSSSPSTSIPTPLTPTPPTDTPPTTTSIPALNNPTRDSSSIIIPPLLARDLVQGGGIGGYGQYGLPSVLPEQFEGPPSNTSTTPTSLPPPNSSINPIPSSNPSLSPSRTSSYPQSVDLTPPDPTPPSTTPSTSSILSLSPTVHPSLSPSSPSSSSPPSLSLPPPPPLSHSSSLSSPSPKPSRLSTSSSSSPIISTTATLVSPSTSSSSSSSILPRSSFAVASASYIPVANVLVVQPQDSSPSTLISDLALPPPLPPPYHSPPHSPSSHQSTERSNFFSNYLQDSPTPTSLSSDLPDSDRGPSLSSSSSSPPLPPPRPPKNRSLLQQSSTHNM